MLTLFKPISKAIAGGIAAAALPFVLLVMPDMKVESLEVAFSAMLGFVLTWIFPANKPAA